MPNDITTLAIEIQSQEAERNLRTFNELLSLSSQTAKKMEKVSIEIDVQGALAQLQALKTGYDDLASSAQNVHIDMGGGEAPTVDTSALEALKDFFTTSAEMSKAMREEMTQFNEALLQLEANSVKAATAGGSHTESMSGGVSMSREYAAALKEVAAAQKEMEKAAEKADEAMKATVAADEDAEAVKQRLMKAQRELADVSKQVNDFHRTQQGNIIELSEKEEYLKNKVAELKSVYEEAKAAAEKFNQKLEESGAKADAARQHYQELKSQLDSMPKTSPMGGASKGAEDFSAKIRLAGRDVTKLTRGISGVASMAGGAIPGVAGLGRAISMLGMGNPYLIAAALAIAAITAAVKAYNDMKKTELEGSREGAELAREQAKQTGEQVKGIEDCERRLGALRSQTNLTNIERQEEAYLVKKLQAEYAKLGIRYDQSAVQTGRLTKAQVEHNLALAEAHKQRLRDSLKRQRESGNKNAEHIWDELAGIGSVQYSLKWRAAAMGPAGAAYEMNGMRLYAQVRGKISDYVKQLQNTTDSSEQQRIIQELEQYVADFKRDHGQFAGIFDLDDVTKAIKGYKDGLKSIQETEKDLEEANNKIGTRARKDVVANLARLRAQQQAAAEMLREMKKTPEQKQQDVLREIARLKAERRALQGERDDKPIYYRGQELTVAEARLRIDTELSKQAAKRYQYEQQITAQIKQQEEKRRAMLARYKYSVEAGGVYVRKDSKDMDRDRSREQNRLFQQMNAMRDDYERRTGRSLDRDFYAGKLPPALRLAFAKKRDRYDELSIQGFEARESHDAVRRQWEAGRKNFVYGRNGQIIREKTDREKDRDLAAELAEAKKRAKRYTEGSEEWHRAMMEVDRLTQEQFRRKQETSYSNLGFSEKQAHNNMVQGVQARSAQALQLETRNFNKPDNAWKTLDRTQTRIYDTVSGYGSHIESMSSNMQNIAGQVAPV